MSAKLTSGRGGRALSLEGKEIPIATTPAACKSALLQVRLVPITFMMSSTGLGFWPLAASWFESPSMVGAETPLSSVACMAAMPPVLRRPHSLHAHSSSATAWTWPTIVNIRAVLDLVNQPLFPPPFLEVMHACRIGWYYSWSWTKYTYQEHLKSLSASSRGATYLNFILGWEQMDNYLQKCKESTKLQNYVPTFTPPHPTLPHLHIPHSHTSTSHTLISVQSLLRHSWKS